MKRLSLLSLLIVFISSSCTSGFGNKLQGEKLDIYYPDKSDVEFADQLGKYWHENALTGSKKQFIQLEKETTFYKIKIIASAEFSHQSLTIDERMLLLGLQRDLNESIFKDLPCRIIICNNEFKELYDINS